MKRNFVRGIWGNCVNLDGIRNGKIHKDVQSIKNNRFSPNFVVYVFGKKNADYLTMNGFKCILIHDEPVKWDMKKQLYRHKLDVFEAAMKDFDEITFLDWDCRAISHVPNDYWDRMMKKAPFQANLFQYRTKKCLWRNEDSRKTCNGGFVYIRDANIPLLFIDNYNERLAWVNEQRIKREARGLKLRFREEAQIFDDEPSMSKWVDDYMGGWKGIDEYWERFEPDVCNLKNKSAFPKSKLDTKDICFLHWG